MDHVTGLHLADHLGAVMKDESLKPLTLIAVDGGESYWHARAGGENRRAMLLDEIVAAHESRISTVRRGLMGWSMGGYGALLAAAVKPELFRAVCTASAALWQSAEEQERAVPDAFDGPADFNRNNVFKEIGKYRGTRMRVDCGMQDPFYGANAALVRALESDGQHPETHFAPGCHDEWYWSRIAYDQLRFMARAL